MQLAKLRGSDMQGLLKAPYGLFLFVLLLVGIETFIALYLEDIGYLDDLTRSDQSHVSMLILGVYLLTSLWFIWLSLRVSQFLDDVRDRRLPTTEPLLKNFMRRAAENREDQAPLLEVLENRLRSSYAFGFNIADLMLKLGILGTVIGFIIMLGSLSQLNSVDITVMQTLLVDMSSGMKVALFTTLTGMLSGIVLNIKFNLLDWAVDHLVNDIKERALDGEVGS
jgi:hypothetical protein